jgi:uncharacterized protein (TIGR03435 family)
VAGATVLAQSRDGGAMTFTQLSIKPSRGVESSFASDGLHRYVMRGGTVSGLIAGGYSTAPPDVRGAPAWVNTERFDIRAAWSAPFAGSVEAMMRTLLAQRFGFSAHYEMIDAPAFAMTVTSPDGTLGPHARPIDVTCPTSSAARPDPRADPPPCSWRSRRRPDGEGISMTANGVTTEQLARMFEIDDAPIVDRTGLTGRFRIELVYHRQYQPQRDSDGAFILVPTGPSSQYADLPVALFEQLGLGLEPITMPKRILVIDRIQRPVTD